MKRIFLIVEVVFWLAVAYIPLAIDHEINDFMVNKCMVGSECLNHSMPLIVQIGLIGLVARILLWPLVAWHLGGRLLGGVSVATACCNLANHKQCLTIHSRGTR